MRSFSHKKGFWISSSGLLLIALTLALVFNFQSLTRALKAHAATDPQTLWQPVPIVSQDALNAGFTPGGEGGQWIRSIKWSPADTNFLLMGTDVGGVYRSIDGGDHWQVTMAGWNDRGANTFAMDPRNGNIALGVGGNGTDSDGNHNVGGVYRTTDKGASWQQVLPLQAGNDDRDSIAYDPSSYDANLGYTTVAYFVSKGNGIYKTTDGGQTWKQIQTGYSGLRIAVHPTKGYVYLVSDQNPCCGTQYGLYKSTDGGQTFTYKGGGYTYGIAVSPAAPDNVWISRYDQVLVSTDDGETFNATGNTGLPPCCNQPWQNITVSPANANYMAVWADLGNYNWVRYYSTDGGHTWGTSDFGHYNNNVRQTQYELLPYNVRSGRWAYSPTDPNTVFSTGGDWITKSTDAGAHFIYHGNGENAIFVDTIAFNPHHTNDVVLASKDYNTYISTDSAHSFTYAQTGFDFGGYDFAGYAMDDTTMWVGDIPNIDSSGNPLLKVSTDGGQTWTKPQYNGADIALPQSFGLTSAGDPTNNDIGFIGNYRTTDHAQTWAPMTGVDDVITYNPSNGTLYGKHGNDVVSSTDHGTTWNTVFTVNGGFREIAYDQTNNRFWIATGSDLKKYENGQLSSVSIPQDQYGTTRVNGVAVDPGNTNIVYAVNNRDIWSATNNVVRSTDGGQTWENLTVLSPLASGGVSGGPHEAWWVTVNPSTHEAWFSTNCYGIWKLPSPDQLVTGTGTGLKGDYFNNRTLNGSPALTRTDSTINFDWGYTPAPGVNYDSFSVRWTGQVQAPRTGSFTFYADINDGARLWVNGQLVIDHWNQNINNWNNYPADSVTGTPITLTAGQKYDIKLEFYENDYGATIKLYWSYSGQAKQIVPQQYLYPAA